MKKIILASLFIFITQVGFAQYYPDCYTSKDVYEINGNDSIKTNLHITFTIFPNHYNTEYNINIIAYDNYISPKYHSYSSLLESGGYELSENIFARYFRSSYKGNNIIAKVVEYIEGNNYKLLYTEFLLNNKIYRSYNTEIKTLD